MSSSPSTTNGIQDPTETRSSSPMSDFPQMIAPSEHIEPVPRRIRAMLGDAIVFDTTAALYVWEWPTIPSTTSRLKTWTSPHSLTRSTRSACTAGTAELYGLHVGGFARPRSARLYKDNQLLNTVRFDWDALDAWFEEDERVFVHPRNPYVRVDALRSTRHVRIELKGVTLAESSSPVLVFETGLPTRYYLNRTEVNFDSLVPTGTVTSCPYKGQTSQYWAVRVGDSTHTGPRLGV